MDATFAMKRKVRPLKLHGLARRSLERFQGVFNCEIASLCSEYIADVSGRLTPSPTIDLTAVALNDHVRSQLEAQSIRCQTGSKALCSISLPAQVYIGRFVPDGPAEVSKEQCIYGNPFVLNDVEDEEERTTCLSNYEQWLLADEQRELVSRAKSELAGKYVSLTECARTLVHLAWQGHSMLVQA